MAVQQVAASTAGHSTTEQDRLKTRRLLRSHNLPYGKNRRQVALQEPTCGVPLPTSQITAEVSILGHVHARHEAGLLDCLLHHAGPLRFGKQFGEPRLGGS
jgi:hypothetical protein